MATTDELLKSVLVMQAEILGRLKGIEDKVGVDHNATNDFRSDAMAELDYLADSDFGSSMWRDLQPVMRKIARFEDH